MSIKCIKIQNGFRTFLALGALACLSLLAAWAPPASGAVGVECAASPAANGTGYTPPPPIGPFLTQLPRRGPDVLYWDPPHAPQLENTGVWTAQPIMISGVSAYRNGEFLYQDFLYDDTAESYPNVPATYAGNAADFVEIRMKLLADALAIRITYNSLLDPEVVATTIALGGSETAFPLPHNAGASMPAEVFVTVHGCTGTIVRASDGAVLPDTPTVATDLPRRQVHVQVPYGAFDPRGQIGVRAAAGTGLWDMVNNQYQRPTATQPAFFNLAFRYNQSLSGFVTTAQNAALNTTNPNLNTFFATVDFVRLAAGTDDDSGVPTTGHMNRIKVSHFETVQGRGSDSAGGGIVGDFRCDDTVAGCTYKYAGRLQPYRLYVPNRPEPAGGWGLVTNMHGAGGNHNWGGDDVWSSLTRAFNDSISMSPLGRGESYFYWGQAGADVFENIADLERHYRINPLQHVSSGLSMGGCGTHKFGVQFPDYWAGLYPNVGCTASEAWGGPPQPALGGDYSLSHRMLASLRQVPVMALYAVGDPLVPFSQFSQVTAAFEAMGYRYDHWYFCSTSGLCFHAEYRGFPPVPTEFENWTRNLVLPVDPQHITYVFNDSMNEPEYGLDSDNAYWLSGLTLRTPSPDPNLVAPLGTIDVFSHGFGLGDPPANITQEETGVIGVGEYTRFTKTWGDAPVIPVLNQLDITANNIATVTIDAARARVGCDATLNITSPDGPLTVTMVGCAPTAVSVAAFGAWRIGSAIRVSWRTGSETSIAGFNVYRNGVKLNRALIAAKRSGQARGASYRFADRTARPGRAYRYRLQVIQLNGKRSFWHVTARS